jgi:outer membrane protein assembly factor BamB
VVGDRAVIAGCDGYVRGINRQTGKEMDVTYLGGNFATAPAYGSGAVFVGDMGGQYAALRLADGKVLWKADLSQNGGASYCSAAVSGDYVVLGSRNQTVFALSRATGKRRWVFAAGAAVDSSPVVAGKRVFVGCDNGRLYCLDLPSGRKVWQYALGSAIAASPALGSDRLVIAASSGTVYCFRR